MCARNNIGEGKSRAKLLALQRIVREKSELQSSIARMQRKIKAAKLRIRELEAAMAMESIDAAGASAITAGESGGDVVGKIGGDK